MHLLKYTFAMLFSFLILATPASAQLGNPLANFKLKYGSPVEFKRHAQLKELLSGGQIPKK